MKKYLQIYHDLLNDIQAKKFKEGDLLPSDTKLVMKYGVSRETVRRAIKLLFDEGYIQTIRGKGSIVLNSDRVMFPFSKIESYKELVTSNHLHSENKIIKIEEPTDVPKNLLFGAPNIATQLIVRKRIVNDLPTVLDYDYINTDVTGIVPKQAALNSLFFYFEHDLGLKINYAIKHITVELADYDDLHFLEIDKHIPIVVVRSETRLADNHILSYTESRHRADKFSSVEFARRHE
ncbi:transcriptional regulator [Lapidilactobacillus dextrinicus DSM 20335]|uniref:Trehalose operon repressor n=1 Tax=Lapidilactobacillus dextrinicus DSM 20335 TaxID=1423738 RepID=A0A0R2BHB6_9LACO|nr:trehalose operon repressor [Lapidilactobacillus dextrinicus]KRM78957.1 transcriptional regulator [Lapidilactobacillus dextrinicus DSM 20335]QFG45992.1 trehalose operon repressor [Lapidilactobacillus dextrinicus]